MLFTFLDLHSAGNDGDLTMTPDPIVDEIKRIREEYAARFNYDLEAIARDVRSRQEGDEDHPLVRRPPRRPSQAATSRKSTP